MTEPSSLWASIRRARMIQVLAVYLGASWVVVQISHTLVEALTLPPWVTPVAIILLLVGLVVILATAWVQSLPGTTEREKAGELPTDWQVAPREALTSLRAGRLPHLTWGRALTGGVVVLALLFGGTGMYVGFSQGGVASPLRASEAAEGIAIVPFEVRGQDLDIWREGMMTLLTSGLDGVGGFRTIDSRTVMARWQEHVGGDRWLDLDATLAVARATGARYALVGNVVGLGTEVRLVANVHDLDTGREVATARAEGPSSDVLRLVDELAVGTMRNLLLASGRSAAGDRSAETITTSSLPALRAFLEGEAHLRRSRFAEAVASYERAVGEDSTFAIALVRLSDAYGWLESTGSARIVEVGARAMAHAHRLSPRYQFFMQGWDALNRGTSDGVASLQEAVRKYPDDPGAWFLLADTYFHLGGAAYATHDDTWHALTQATTLEPNFAPYLVHLAEVAVLRGDRPSAEAAVKRYEALTGEREPMEHVRLAIPVLLGDSAEAAAAVQGAAELPLRVLQFYNGTFARRHDRWDQDAAMDRVMGRVAGRNRDNFEAYYAGSAGEIERAAAIVARPTVDLPNRATFWAHMHNLWDRQPPPGIIRPESCAAGGSLNSTCMIHTGLAAARLGLWSEHARFVQRLRSEAAADTMRAESLLNVANLLEGSGAWRRGDVARGRALLEVEARREGSGDMARIELAYMEVEAGRPTQALRQFRSVLDGGFIRPAGLYGAARMLEELGQPDEARRYWASFVTLTDKADDLPRVREAREALARRVRGSS